MLGIFILPLHRSIPPDNCIISNTGKNNENIIKYCVAPGLISSVPPSISGSSPLMPEPDKAIKSPNTAAATKDWRNTDRALRKSFAPTKCATCTVNPIATALHNPIISHVEVETRPIEAEASAPTLPTMAASIYCMAIEENCATMAGILSCTTSESCWRNVIVLPSRIIRNRRSTFALCASVAITLQNYATSP